MYIKTVSMATKSQLISLKQTLIKKNVAHAHDNLYGPQPKSNWPDILQTTPNIWQTHPDAKYKKNTECSLFSQSDIQSETNPNQRGW